MFSQWGEMGKDFCPNFLQPFLENIDRRSCNDGGGGSHLEVSCRGALLGRVEGGVGEKKQVRINIQNARDYLEGRNQVSPKYKVKYIIK